MSVQDFRELLVWQHSLALVKNVYRLTAGFPKEELYGLTSQMRRAAVSVSSNIAEGHERATKGEFLQFLGHARGSLAELLTQSYIAGDLAFGDSTQLRVVRQNIGEVKKMLAGLITALQQKRPTTH